MSGTVIGVWLSLVERYVRDVEVAGSNPVTPIDPPQASVCGVFYCQKPLIPKLGRGFFFCRLFLSGTYTKGDMDSPAHPNRFFCKRKIPYAHKNQWLVDFAH